VVPFFILSCFIVFIPFRRRQSRFFSKLSYNKEFRFLPFIASTSFWLDLFYFSTHLDYVFILLLSETITSGNGRGIFRWEESRCLPVGGSSYFSFFAGGKSWLSKDGKEISFVLSGWKNSHGI